MTARVTSWVLVEMWKDSRSRWARTDPMILAWSIRLVTWGSATAETMAESPAGRLTPAEWHTSGAKIRDDKWGQQP